MLAWYMSTQAFDVSEDLQNETIESGDDSAVEPILDLQHKSSVYQALPRGSHFSMNAPRTIVVWIG